MNQVLGFGAFSNSDIFGNPYGSPEPMDVTMNMAMDMDTFPSTNPSWSTASWNTPSAFALPTPASAISFPDYDYGCASPSAAAKKRKRVESIDLTVHSLHSPRPMASISRNWKKRPQRTVFQVTMTVTPSSASLWNGNSNPTVLPASFSFCGVSNRTQATRATPSETMLAKRTVGVYDSVGQANEVAETILGGAAQGLRHLKYFDEDGFMTIEAFGLSRLADAGFEGEAQCYEDYSMRVEVSTTMV